MFIRNYDLQYGIPRFKKNLVTTLLSTMRIVMTVGIWFHMRHIVKISTSTTSHVSHLHYPCSRQSQTTKASHKYNPRDINYFFTQFRGLSNKVTSQKSLYTWAEYIITFALRCVTFARLSACNDYIAASLKIERLKNGLLNNV